MLNELEKLREEHNASGTNKMDRVRLDRYVYLLARELEKPSHVAPLADAEIEKRLARIKSAHGRDFGPAQQYVMESVPWLISTVDTLSAQLKVRNDMLLRAADYIEKSWFPTPGWQYAVKDLRELAALSPTNTEASDAEA